MKSFLERNSTSDLIWASGSLVFTLMLSFTLLGSRFLGSSTLDLHFHDTYIVVDNWFVFIAMLLFVLFLDFYFKTSRREYRTQTSFLIVLFCGFTITMLITGLVAFLRFLLSGGWTIYPPLSALGINDLGPSGTDSPLLIFNLLAVICQIVVVILSFRCAVRLGDYRASLREGR
jgi:hypothetical protein